MGLRAKTLVHRRHRGLDTIHALDSRHGHSNEQLPRAGRPGRTEAPEGFTEGVQGPGFDAVKPGCSSLWMLCLALGRLCTHNGSRGLNVGIEIERKFKLKSVTVLEGLSGNHFLQA